MIIRWQLRGCGLDSMLTIENENILALAPTSREIHSSSSPTTSLSSEERGDVDEIDELDREPELERPRLSLPITQHEAQGRRINERGKDKEDEEDEDEGEESSPELRPPRLSLTMDEMTADLTHRSYEFPRRMAMEKGDDQRLSMMSYGDGGSRVSENVVESTRLSENDGGDFSGMQDEDEEVRDETTVISQGAFDRG